MREIAWCEGNWCVWNTVGVRKREKKSPVEGEDVIWAVSNCKVVCFSVFLVGGHGIFFYMSNTGTRLVKEIDSASPGLMKVNIKSMAWRAVAPLPIPHNEFAPHCAGTMELCQRSIITLTEKHTGRAFNSLLPPLLLQFTPFGARERERVGI